MHRESSVPINAKTKMLTFLFNYPRCKRINVYMLLAFFFTSSKKYIRELKG